MWFCEFPQSGVGRCRNREFFQEKRQYRIATAGQNCYHKIHKTQEDGGTALRRKRDRNFGIRWLRDLLCGVLIGAGAILPGVSGGALPRHVHFVLDEFAAMPLPGFTRELATMRSRNISASTIIQNMAQIKELYKDSWETIPGNSDTILYLGGKLSRWAAADMPPPSSAMGTCGKGGLPSGWAKWSPHIPGGPWPQTWAGCCRLLSWTSCGALCRTLAGRSPVLTMATPCLPGWRPGLLLRCGCSVAKTCKPPAAKA